MATILNTARPDPAFDPEAITVLAAAFDEAWDRLRQSGSECVRPAYARAMKEILARRIIEMAQRGTTDQRHQIALDFKIKISKGIGKKLQVEYRYDVDGDSVVLSLLKLVRATVA